MDTAGMMEQMLIPVSAKCSWKRQMLSAVAISGERQRGDWQGGESKSAELGKKEQCSTKS
jgi:hypothetical protein